MESRKLILRTVDVIKDDIEKLPRNPWKAQTYKIIENLFEVMRLLADEYDTHADH